jgi:hypothetical protein
VNFLPGWFPGAAGAVAAGLTTLTQVASATAQDSTTITGPASIQAGDLLVLYDTAFDSSGIPTTAVPSGFTIISNVVGLAGDSRLISSYKIATGAEASAALSGLASDVPASGKGLYVFRGNIPITSAAVQDIGQQSTSGNPTSQTVTAASGIAPLIVFGCYTAFGTVNPRTFSADPKDGEINFPDGVGVFDNWLAYRIDNASGSNTSIDMDDEGTENYLSSFYIECS